MEEDPISSLHPSPTVPAEISGSRSDCLDHHLKTKTASTLLLLKDFCKFIDDCPSLARATIREVQCYKAKNIIHHRFLLLQCRRLPRSVVWIRIERKMGGKMVDFIRKGGVVKAHDTVRRRTCL
jgi:hypothetical protein